MKSFAEINRFIDGFVISLDSQGRYSLDRIKQLLAELDNPQEKFKIVHIAGTSGKTSSAYYVAAMLGAAGYKTGLTVSPHIDEINERVQIGLKPLSETEFCAAFNEFIKELNKSSIKPTYFELLIAFAFWYFAKARVDYAVVEVGLGGLLDATNTIKRADKVCIITDIGLDHTRILGNKLPEIAAQKAGIIQQGNTVFMNQQDSIAVENVKSMAEQKQAGFNVVKPAKDVLTTNLADFQQRNWTLSKKACEYIFQRDKHHGLSQQQWRKTAEVVIPGRLEVVSYKNKIVVLDGAHNAQKMHTFAASFKAKFPNVRPPVVLAIAETKNLHLADIVAELKQLSNLVIITTFKNDQDTPVKSIEPEEIAKYFGQGSTLIEKDINRAMEYLLAQKENVLLVTGSLYLLREARKTLTDKS